MLGSISVAAPGVVTTASLQIVDIEWTGSGSIGDALVIVDNNGRDIWRATAGGPSYAMSKGYGRPVPYFGVNVTTLTSGKVTITYV